MSAWRDLAVLSALERPIVVSITCVHSRVTVDVRQWSVAMEIVVKEGIAKISRYARFMLA